MRKPVSLLALLTSQASSVVEHKYRFAKRNLLARVRLRFSPGTCPPVLPLLVSVPYEFSIFLVLEVQNILHLGTTSNAQEHTKPWFQLCLVEITNQRAPNTFVSFLFVNKADALYMAPPATKHIVPMQLLLFAKINVNRYSSLYFHTT